MTKLWCESALVEGSVEAAVAIEIADGRFASVEANTPPGTATRLGGFTIPGMANAHSHAFHRALRSRTQTDQGSFWTWRALMYRAAERLDPDSYRRLARAVFAEMVMAGISCVGEFHYLHHQPDGTPYDDLNEMGKALLAAADEAGIRITLLDTLYLHGGLQADGYEPATGAQRRFADRSVDAWADRVNELEPMATHRIGSAVHSVRAVDPVAAADLANWAQGRAAPVHAHLSEQVAENDACRGFHNRSPTELLADSGMLSPRFSAVHATHVVGADITALGASGSMVVMCPTTERDLGDGIGPTGQFVASGVSIALGSDSHAVIDLLEEARLVELHERLRSQRRGIHQSANLLAMATVNGHRSLGWDDAGSIDVGQRADLVTVALDSVRTVGANPANAIEAAVFAANASDITDVFVDGRQIVSDRRHARIDVSAELDKTIKELMGP